MDIAIFIFLSSGLFLGWSLGANDAANVFGTAVGSRMIRFTTAAIICSAFVILGARAFFRNIAAVRDHLGKVSFHEEECDQCATRLKRDIFGSALGLDRKMHLRYFVDKIDNLADEAEDVGDWLAIYSIKRAL